ncbi:hypothetical protein ACP45A_00565, partial [Vibrio genomosp. F10]
LGAGWEISKVSKGFLSYGSYPLRDKSPGDEGTGVEAFLISTTRDDTIKVCVEMTTMTEIGVEEKVTTCDGTVNLGAVNVNAIPALQYSIYDMKHRKNSISIDDEISPGLTPGGRKPTYTVDTHSFSLLNGHPIKYVWRGCNALSMGNSHAWLMGSKGKDLDGSTRHGALYQFAINRGVVTTSFPIWVYDLNIHAIWGDGDTYILKKAETQSFSFDTNGAVVFAVLHGYFTDSKNDRGRKYTAGVLPTNKAKECRTPITIVDRYG